jgi:high-affinity iron transporter
VLGQYLVTFREVFEAALATAIILSYLARSRRNHLSRYVWCGVLLATVASLGAGTFILVVFQGLPEAFEPLFEGTAAFVAVAVLSAMI